MEGKGGGRSQKLTMILNARTCFMYTTLKIMIIQEAQCTNTFFYGTIQNKNVTKLPELGG